MTEIQLLETHRLSSFMLCAVRSLLQEAFADEFSEEDWTHALGGCHAIVRHGGVVVAHAAAVERTIVAGSRPYRTGYVEAVAVSPAWRRNGLGTIVMRRLTELIDDRFELGALSSGERAFYERLGWERWRGPSYVRRKDGSVVRSEEEDDAVMVLRCAASRDIDLTTSITCDERAGDSW